MAFAVIDFETTGLVPELGDRIVEVGLVLVDDLGQIEREWTTLVNPRRDIGASQVHGLCGADLIDAPEFADVADEILEFVIGRTLVAHNAIFDMRFLHKELERAGYPVSGRPPALCSMKWSGRLVGPAKLQHACEALGIELLNAHSALADARATAALLGRLMRLAKSETEWSDDLRYSRDFSWPKLQGRQQSQPVIRGQNQKESLGWLHLVLEAAWVPGVPEDEAAYLLVLDRALLDRTISLSEGRQLVDAVREAGLSGAAVARLHRSYLMSVAHEALSDGVLTDAERSDIEAVASALGLTKADIKESLDKATESQAHRKSGETFMLRPGDRVVFTGESSRPRESWVTEIVAAGLTSGGVTKTTRLVVAADPDSLSGKAAKARTFGIPIVDEKTFSRLFQKYRSESVLS